MTAIEWKYVETVQKRVRIIKVDAKNRSLDVFDLDLGFPVNFNVKDQVDLGKVKRAKIYLATVEIYKSEFTEELERQMVESALGDPVELRKIQVMKASGSKPTRFDITELKH
jgi:hypothetical protein